ncbi:cupin domain-containing protein [Flagellimonas flava]|uniref:DUF985 domain-containing protein n=1 Tax=Flagellimonas flava TaxID=570519 RepID=A0A1M5PR38_9FLAO|nr:cupin domain-containing protein [Allomuricauda flava]SHH03999.1 hypothetical protein SAMN04488116_3334 [Allomuricauda flava]
MNRISQLISNFGLQPHPEGGYFKETYRSDGLIPKISLPSHYPGNRNYATAIYFLLTSDTFSAFHRIKQDEIWHFYEGSPIKLHVISETGAYTEQLIGTNFSAGEVPQFVVPGNHWFAAETVEPNSYSFVGCTVSPGFDFADFVMADGTGLAAQFPDLGDVIGRLTR